jgi:hypothetical protein
LLTRAIARDRPVHPAEYVILYRVGGKGKDRKKKSAQSARQAAHRRAVQQRTAERRVRDLRFRLLSARDASAAAGRLMGAFADQDQVSCAYDAEATVSAVAGRMAQAGFAGDRLRDACLDICDALAASSAPLAVGILRAFAVAGPDSAVRDHAGTLADAAGRTAPAWAAELGQAIPGKCWVTTDPFRESTVLLCEFRYPARGNRHAVLARLDPVWHDAVSSLAALFLEEESSLDAGSAMGLARRLGADLREVPPAEAAGLLRAGLDAFARHGPAPWAKRDSEDYRTTLGLAALADQRAGELAAAAEGAGQATEAPSGTTAGRWPPGERERLVTEFYRSPQGRTLTGVVARFLPRDLVAFCADYLGRDPLRPGPLLFRRLLRDVLPMQLVLPARLADDVAPVIRAWAAWTADRASLPKRLRRRLLSELDGELREFPAVLAAASQKPHNRYFQDLPDDVISDDTRCQQALQRRYLAVPLHHDLAQGAGTLDAAEPSERAKITELWLAGRGIPRDERASYQAVVEELWAGEPPQVTEQALRMAADGLSRDTILDKLVQGH